MRLLKTAALVAAVFVYMCLVVFLPFKVFTVLLGVFIIAAVFLYGYFNLFNPNK